MFIVAQQLKFVLGVIANSNIGIKIQFLAVTNLFLRKHVSSINSNVGWIKKLRRNHDLQQCRPRHLQMLLNHHTRATGYTH